jgi:hypothetical protein
VLQSDNEDEAVAVPLRDEEVPHPFQIGVGKMDELTQPLIPG